MSYILQNDKIIEDQLWGCYSFILSRNIPNHEKTNKIISFKQRGVFPTKELAEDHKNKIEEYDKDFLVLICKVGEWLPYSYDISDLNLNLNDELNKLESQYIESRIKSKEIMYKRIQKSKDLLEDKSKSNNEIKIMKDKIQMIEDKFNNCVNVDIEDDKYLETIKNDLLYIDLPEEEIKKNISNNKNTTDIDNNTNNIDDNYNNILDDDQNKIIIDRLYDDDIINDQQWGCFSFILPENVKDPETNYIDDNVNKNIVGFIHRGNFKTEEDAYNHIADLKLHDKNHNIYVGKVGSWLPFSDEDKFTNNIKYHEKELDDIAKSYDNQRKKASNYINLMENNNHYNTNKPDNKSTLDKIKEIKSKINYVEKKIYNLNNINNSNNI